MSAEEPTPDEFVVPPEAVWSWPRRLLFRFALLYFVLYALPFPISYLPNPASLASALEVEWKWAEPIQPLYRVLDAFSSACDTAEKAAVDWVAEDVLALPGPKPVDRPLGSGDPTHSYIELIVQGGLALVLALVWSLFDRRPRAHDRLAPWLHLGARYLLAITLFGYGFAKIVPRQFPEPSLARLLAPWGDASPMNVLWSFMGSSPAYVVFSGVAEVLGAVLLVFRRTATLGALVAAAVMTNVVALNFCYDVPVKLYSSHLLLLALAICLPDLRRLYAVFVANAPSPARDLSRPRFPYVGHPLRFLFVGYYVLLSAAPAFRSLDSEREVPELYGIWDVERFVMDGEERAPRTDDPLRWQNLVVEESGWASLRSMDGTRAGHRLTHTSGETAVELSRSSAWTYRLEGEELVLHGEHQRVHRPRLREEASADNPQTRRGPQVEVRLVRSSAEVSPDGLWPFDGGSETEAEEPEGDAPLGTDTQVHAPPLRRLVGRWEVSSHEVVGDTWQPRSRTLPAGWTAWIIEEGAVFVEYEGGHRDRYELVVDPDAGDLTLSASLGLSLERLGPDRIVLSGDRLGHEVEVELSRRDLQEFLLLRRGFHWINEIPLNRY